MQGICRKEWREDPRGIRGRGWIFILFYYPGKIDQRKQHQHILKKIGIPRL